MIQPFHYVAARTIKVGRGTIRKQGEHVPEADTFIDPDVWVQCGDLLRVPGLPPGGPGTAPAGVPAPAAALPAALSDLPPQVAEAPPVVESTEPVAEQLQDETPARQPAPTKAKAKAKGRR